MNEQNERININNNNNLQNRSRNKSVLYIILFIVIIILIYNIYQFIHIINKIKKEYLNYPFNVFEQCYLYNNLLDLFVEFLSFFLGIDLIFLVCLPFIEMNMEVEFELFISKFSQIFVYFNYIIFGPFWIGWIILGIKNYQKIIYICENSNPERKIINSRLISIFVFSLSIPTFISFLGLFYFENNFFSNSIKLKKSGNFLIGNIFWEYALKHSNSFNNSLNRNNSNNEIILDNRDIQDENQNLI